MSDDSIEIWNVMHHVADFRTFRLKKVTSGDVSGGFVVEMEDETGAWVEKVFFPECSVCGQPCSEGTYNWWGETQQTATHKTCHIVRLNIIAECKEAVM